MIGSVIATVSSEVTDEANVNPQVEVTARTNVNPQVDQNGATSTQAGQVLNDSTLNPQATQFLPASHTSTPEEFPDSHVSFSQMRETFDSWIDNLVIGQETSLSGQANASLPSITQMVAHLEAERDLPTLELPMFDGTPLMWPRFTELFYTQVPTRQYLTDVRRMALLQMHVKGEAKKLIQGLGYSGRNYTQCLKELKFAFGHKLAVARAYIDGVTN